MSANWTPDQKRAIEERGHSLLISAAAGSGKTTVLVERVISRITDPASPCDIDEFVLVTFTRAAAAEMKARIADALTAKLMETPSDRRLRRQLTLLNRAKISTVHGFCADILRDNFQEAGLTPDFRVADETEMSLLRRRVLDELIEGLYEDNSEENSGFYMLLDALTDDRGDDRLGQVILETYDKLQSHPFPDRFLASCMENAERSASDEPEHTVFGQEIISTARRRAEYAMREYGAALDMIDRSGELSAYAPIYVSDMDSIQNLLDALDTGWDATAACLKSISFPRLPSLRNISDKEYQSLVKAPRDAWRKALAKLRDKYLFASSARVREDMAAVLPYYKALFGAVSKFSSRLDDAKRRRGIVDFADLEHGAVRILVQSIGEDGTVYPSETAAELSSRWREIMVDEYQDTNMVQDVIFRAVSRGESNLFMVGDVKQSIYRFRLADPTIFIKKSSRFAQNDGKADTAAPRKIELSWNFRSRGNIISGVNYIFSHIMSKDLGGVDYQNQPMVPKAEYPPAPDDACEFCLVEPNAEDEQSAAEADAEYVAGRVEKLLSDKYPVYDRETGEMRPVEPDDIVILLRTRTQASAYRQALEKRGVSVHTDAGENLYDAPEAMMLISLLEAIDNPEQDIPVASVMRSPLYGFTPDELAIIRLASPGKSFFAAVQSYAGQDLAERCGEFVRDLDAYRLAAQDMPTDRLITHILNKTNLYGLTSAMGNASVRRETLRTILTQAERFERSGYRGLHMFIVMQRHMRSEGSTPRPNADTPDAVRIMTVHRSKGLEFPVVVFAGAAHQFNMDDFKRSLLIHPVLGAGFRRREPDRRIEYPTIARLAIECRERRELMSEEMRILYVALTRAKEKLIVTAPLKNIEKFASNLRTASGGEQIEPEFLEDCPSPLKWLLAPILRLPGTDDALHGNKTATSLPWRLVISRTCDHDDGKACAASETQTNNETVSPIPLLADRLRTEYPYTKATDTPSKVTATSLKGRFVDSELADGSREVYNKQEKRHTRPRFIMDGALSPSERGNALHLAMQLCDFDRCRSKDEIDVQLSDMVTRKLLTQQQADAVDASRILGFFLSPLGKRVKNALYVRREFKFSLLAPAFMLNDMKWLSIRPNPSDDSVLFQGVVDCWFEESEGISIIDFKTDFIRPGMAGDLTRRYRPQLESYAMALRRITGKPVINKYIYSFSLNKALEI